MESKNNTQEEIKRLRKELKSAKSFRDQARLKWELGRAQERVKREKNESKES